jgi:xanthine dehydrogenase accessory factor
LPRTFALECCGFATRPSPIGTPPGLASTKSLRSYPLAERDSLLRQRRRLSEAPFADGRSRLVSVWPEDALAQQGVEPGHERAGVRFAKNMCPSQGSMDIFVEPVLPQPWVVVCGSSPVAVAFADFAKHSGFAVTVCAPAAEQSAFDAADRRIEGYALPVQEAGARYVVVSTQGRGDEAALLAALAIEADYIAFVGSRKKADALKSALLDRGVAPERLAKLKAPAALDLGAITPDEIAIAILAEIVAVRRGKQLRGAAVP